MKTSGIFACAMFACLVTAGYGRAQIVEAPNAPDARGRIENAISLGGKYQDYIYGVVKKIEKDELILDKTVYGNDQSFKLEHNTRFIHNGKPSSLAALKIGDMVWVDAKLKKKTDEKIARKVITGVPLTGKSK